MNRAAGGLALALSLALGAAEAVVAPALSLEQQARRADLIIRGSLGTPQTVTEGTVTWRVYPLTLTETVAGDAGRLPRQAAGPALYVWSEAADLPQWRTGQDAFFLLYAARLDSPLVGYNQGYYPVVDGQVALTDRQPEGGAVTPAPSLSSTATPASARPLLPQPQSPEPEPEPEPSELPPAADVAPDAPLVPESDTEPATVPGLPSADTLAPAPDQSAQVSRPAAASSQVNVDEFRALLLRARSSSPASAAQGGEQ
ncbi:hypothetical protein GCM10017783_22130 [Deinococcus piscis]|uniref:Uncharacterized protein n=1 Tax=Deinococcus piscis TaxID=394230 RepID=A0ABQ3KDS6_9DEIO|nr:hypothetical protein [Deinococcus piscis]GHG09086.1 hypothetical protein GCM10017783_22130 [Deinococcus piscis]